MSCKAAWDNVNTFDLIKMRETTISIPIQFLLWIQTVLIAFIGNTDEVEDCV